MHKFLQLIAGLLLLALLCASEPTAAQGVCDPFTRVQPVDALPIGTSVTFLNWEWYGPVSKTGVIDAYAVQSCWPGGFYPPGLDAVAYVVSYGDPRGARVVLNRSRFEVR
jgi:hypothetical protein